MLFVSRTVFVWSVGGRNRRVVGSRLFNFGSPVAVGSRLSSSRLLLHEVPDQVLLFFGVIEVFQNQEVIAGCVEDYIAEVEQPLD